MIVRFTEFWIRSNQRWLLLFFIPIDNSWWL